MPAICCYRGTLRNSKKHITTKSELYLFRLNMTKNVSGNNIRSKMTNRLDKEYNHYNSSMNIMINLWLVTNSLSVEQLDRLLTS